MTKIRRGQAPEALTRRQFHTRSCVRFFDPAFAAESDAIARLEEIAWVALQEGRKAPLTRAAGPEFADPTCQVTVQWTDTRKRVSAAHKRWSDRTAASRVLLICGSARNDGTCPREASKTSRLTELARQDVEDSGVEAHRRNLTDGLEWMGLVDAGAASRLDRCIGLMLAGEQTVAGHRDTLAALRAS